MSVREWLSPAGMLAGFVSKVFTGPVISAGVEAWKAKLDKDNDVNHVLADITGKQILLDQRQRELDAQVIVAEQGNWFTRWPRAIVQWSLALYIAKVVVWDIVLGLGSTPSIRDHLVTNAFNLIIVMWFGGRTLEKITGNIMNRIK